MNDEVLSGAIIRQKRCSRTCNLVSSRAKPVKKGAATTCEVQGTYWQYLLSCNEP